MNRLIKIISAATTFFALLTININVLASEREVCDGAEFTVTNSTPYNLTNGSTDEPSQFESGSLFTSVPAGETKTAYMQTSGTFTNNELSGVVSFSAEDSHNQNVGSVVLPYHYTWGLTQCYASVGSSAPVSSAGSDIGIYYNTSNGRGSGAALVYGLNYVD